MNVELIPPDKVTFHPSLLKNNNIVMLKNELVLLLYPIFNLKMAEKH